MSNVMYYRLTDELIPVFYKKICIHCNNETQFLMTQDDYDRWKVNGEYIQNVFPEEPKDIREWMISGTHPKCWDEMFPEEDLD
jgi:hypothetical protein